MAILSLQARGMRSACQSLVSVDNQSGDRELTRGPGSRPKMAALVTVFAGPRWASRKVAGERQEEADQAPQRAVNQSAPLRVTRPACVVGGLHSELTTRIRATRVTGKERRRDLGAPLRVRVVRLYEPRTHLPCRGNCSSRPKDRSTRPHLVDQESLREKGETWTFL